MWIAQWRNGRSYSDYNPSMSFAKRDTKINIFNYVHYKYF